MSFLEYSALQTGQFGVHTATKLACLASLILHLAAVCPAAPASFPAANAMIRRPACLPLTNDVSMLGQWHSVLITPPKTLPKIHLTDKLNPLWWFKNADDPVPPAWFAPGARHRPLKWFLRNPYHNLSFYVLGIADKQQVRSGRYPTKIGKPKGGWNFALSKYKWIRLPFISYSRHKIDFYLGWRPRGNLGAKLNINAKRPPPEKPGNLSTPAPSVPSTIKTQAAISFHTELNVES